eukprot:comp19486_c0_seq1/m.37017 comp19486_c0_seq1/g.37017  ORF comp19486_c0_seq1/g.37017 comp19486_c0_seq1/m.37017 type:complete len:357 (+) comp19486_c0_seq1:470-1540(+)
MEQKLFDAVKIRNLVHIEQQRLGAPVENALHGHHGIEQLLHLGCIAQNDVRIAVAARKHNTGAVENLDLGVDHNLLHRLCHTGHRANHGGLFALERVDQRRLADIRIADHTDRDCGLHRAAVARVVLQQLHKRIGAQRLGGLQCRCGPDRREHTGGNAADLLLLGAALSEIAALVLSVGLEQHRRELVAQDLEPAGSIVLGHEIDLVHHKHNLLVRVLCENVLLNVWAAAAHWVAGVQDLENHICGLDNLVELAVEPTRALVLEHLLARIVGAHAGLARTSLLKLGPARICVVQQILHRLFLRLLLLENPALPLLLLVLLAALLLSRDLLENLLLERPRVWNPRVLALALCHPALL